MSEILNKHLNEKGKELSFRQLHNGDVLNDDSLKAIAGLIYDTDPYIYPAMFGTRNHALELIPELIRRNDAMFQLDNLYIAEYNGNIIGMVLWNRGKLEWSKELFLETANDLHVPVSRYLDMVTERYVNSYAEVEEKDLISIINFCISEEVRGIGAGSRLMKSFLEAYGGEPLELCVLEENPAAVRLYQKYGFEETCRYPGFSADARDLVCIGMKKKA